MKLSFLRGMSAITIMLLGAATATAYPLKVNNNTSTQANGPGFTGADFKTSIKSGGTVRRNAQNTIARQFTTTTYNDLPSSAPTYGGAQVKNRSGGNTFSTFCIELTENLDSAKVATGIESIPPASPAPDGLYYASQSQGVLERATWVIGYAASIAANATKNAALSGLTGTTRTNAIASAIQLAIWEIVYDAADTVTGSIGAYGSASQGFIATATGADQVKAVNFAQTLLNESFGKKGSGLTFRLQVIWDPVQKKYVELGTTGNPNDFVNQSVIAYVVPEPSTFAIAGLSTLGLLGYGLRRRRATSN